MDIKNITAFLTELQSNNNKEWMDANNKWYQETKGQFEELVAHLLGGITQFDQGLQGLEPKKCIFRVNRDVRFSKNKDPYKTNYGAAMAEGGRKSGNPLYYFHLEPGRAFVAGGVYMPEADPLKKIRQEIDYNPEELKRIVEQPDFKKAFGGIQGEGLKTAPKGYPKDHPNIELLRRKSFIVVHDLSPVELRSEFIVEASLSLYKLIKPFNDYLSVAIS
ncbi:DUF2461 domain-containing protein [Marinoscillum sp. MHG1-6]|uniref:DUF2461 domain-containing protein n=1 Tax=Marinoscillum sp. MHG1-6 TaxID=2959627 RepID=UPI0021582E1C|nr:DUF2461 domain-containing protein [Marinoscillum sp. MHG1-6]